MTKAPTRRAPSKLEAVPAPPQADEAAAAERAREAAEKFREKVAQQPPVVSHSPAQAKPKSIVVGQGAGTSADADNARKSGHAIFRSRLPEVARFDVKFGEKVVRCGFDKDPAYLIWVVPKDLLEAFRNHHFVRTQRIVEEV